MRCRLTDFVVVVVVNYARYDLVCTPNPFCFFNAYTQHSMYICLVMFHIFNFTHFPDKSLGTGLIPSSYTANSTAERKNWRKWPKLHTKLYGRKEELEKSANPATQQTLGQNGRTGEDSQSSYTANSTAERTNWRIKDSKSSYTANSTAEWKNWRRQQVKATQQTLRQQGGTREDGRSSYTPNSRTEMKNWRRRPVQLYGKLDGRNEELEKTDTFIWEIGLSSV